MQYYMGGMFDKEDNKQYKKLEAAEKAAERQHAAVFGEDGTVLADFRREQDEGLEPGTGQPTADPSGTAPEPATDIIEGIPAARVKGSIRRVFKGSIRLRDRPSWDMNAVKGAVAFETKVVTHVMEVEGKAMYRTADGYFISGAPELVEYIEG